MTIGSDATDGGAGLLVPPDFQEVAASRAGTHLRGLGRSVRRGG